MKRSRSLSTSNAPWRGLTDAKHLNGEDKPKTPGACEGESTSSDKKGVTEIGVWPRIFSQGAFSPSVQRGSFELAEYDKFKRLELKNWRQFDVAEIQFHPRLTIITGENGSGKSTLLSVLANNFGWSRRYLGVPSQNGKTGAFEFSTSARDDFHSIESQSISGNESYVGSILYESGAVAALLAPKAISDFQYDITIRDRKSVYGFHVSSHKPMPTFANVKHIPTAPMLPPQAYNGYSGLAQTSYREGRASEPALSQMKSALISMALFGEGNSNVQPNPVVREAYIQFVEVLRKVLPQSLGFQRLKVQPPYVLLQTVTGDFPMDAVSGGVMTILDLAWQIFLYAQNHDHFAVTIDEPENHLHPSMQRSLLGTLVEAFPRVQFIVATHSPFVVSSVADASVYALRSSDSLHREATQGAGPSAIRRFVSEGLDNVTRAGDAADVLKEVLGVPVTMPIWVERNLDALADEFRAKSFNEATLNELRQRLKLLGYSQFYPETLSRVRGGGN